MSPIRIARIVGGVAVAAFGVATMATAQVASSFSGLQGSLRAGDRLTITDRAGIVTTGRFVTVSDQTLRLMVRSVPPLDVSESSVAKIEHVTSHKRRGALLGLIGGALVGAAWSDHRLIYQAPQILPRPSARSGSRRRPTSARVDGPHTIKGTIENIRAVRG